MCSAPCGPGRPAARGSRPAGGAARPASRCRRCQWTRGGPSRRSRSRASRHGRPCRRRSGSDGRRPRVPRRPAASCRRRRRRRRLPRRRAGVRDGVAAGRHETGRLARPGAVRQVPKLAAMWMPFSLRVIVLPTSVAGSAGGYSTRRGRRPPIRGGGPQGRRTRSPLGRRVRPSSDRLGRRRRAERLGRAGDGPLRPAPCRLG